MIPFIILVIESDEDRDFMIALYEEYCSMMEAAIVEVIGNSDAKADIVHDVVAALIPKISLLRSFNKGQLESYVFRSAHNKAVNYIIKFSREKKLRSDEKDDTVSPTEIPMEEAFEKLENYKKVGQIIMKLPDRERDILIQKYFLLHSDEEIAESLGIKKNSVREYLTRARRLLREYLMREGVSND